MPKKTNVKISRSRQWGPPQVYHAPHSECTGYYDEVPESEAIAAGLRKCSKPGCWRPPSA